MELPVRDVQMLELDNALYIFLEDFAKLYTFIQI